MSKIQMTTPLVENVHLAESIMTLSYRIHSHNQ